MVNSNVTPQSPAMARAALAVLKRTLWANESAAGNDAEAIVRLCDAAARRFKWKVESEGGREVPRPNPEVLARAKRRTYTGEYNVQVLAEADAARGTGEIGALLRRHRRTPRI